MTKHGRFRFGRLGLPGLLLLAGLMPAWLAGAAPMTLEDFEVGPYNLGGDFTLTNHLGKKTRLSQYKGKAVALFFGYTFCPDVCPTTLVEFQKMQKLLGPDARRVQPLFITVDPARDTAPRLKSYLANFGGNTIGLTGSEAELRAVATLFQARFARSSATVPGGYLMDHTGFVYLLDGTGKVRYVMTPDAGGALMAEAARKLLKG